MSPTTGPAVPADPPSAPASRAPGTVPRKIALNGGLTAVAEPNPRSDDGFCSDRVRVLHWRVDEPFGDVGTYLHRDSDEVYVVLDGAGTLEVEGTATALTEGMAIFVPAGAEHRFTAYEQLALLVIFNGPHSG